MPIWIAEVDEPDPTTPQRYVVFESRPDDIPVQQFDSLVQAALVLIGPEAGDVSEAGDDAWQRRWQERTAGRFLPSSAISHM